MSMVEEARGGEGLPESAEEVVGDRAARGEIGAAWGRAWGRRQRGNRGESLAFKGAWLLRVMVASL